MQETRYFKLYKALTGKGAVLIRILLFALLSLVLLLYIDSFEVLVKLLPLYFVLFLQELFIHNKLEKTNPEKTVSEAQNLYDAITFVAWADLISKHTSYEIADSISKTKQGRFFINKINPSLKLSNVEIEKNKLLEEAANFVKALNAKYISSVDLLAAYIVLQEDVSKLMEQENLTKQDILVILYWTRDKFSIEKKGKTIFDFKGGGAFDSLVYGWTPATNQFTSDFTSEVLRLNYKPKAIGRDKEYREIIESLNKNSATNVILIGNTGAGKTNLVIQFAYDAYHGTLTSNLKNKRVYFLFIDRLLSGANEKGEIEKRLNNIFTEISHAGNIIIFIENIDNIFGGGGFNFDIGGAIEPYLSGNKVQIVGTTTPQAYKDFISVKPTLAPLFNEIHVNDPDEKTATFMLIEDVNIKEKLSPIIVTYTAVKEIINSANLYENDISLPGSAVKLLDDVIVREFNGGKNIIDVAAVRKIINDKTGVNLSTPTKEEKKELLNLEDTFHKNLIGQDEAVISVSNAIRRLRSGIRKGNGPIASFLFLGPTGVGKTTTAKLLAGDYFGSEEKLIRVDMSEYQTQDSINKLLGELPGEESFSDSFMDKVLRNPFSVVLLDEFEKAHPKLLDVFLQILDEGFVTNNKGKRISFSNSIIIATSNAGSEFIREKIVTGNEDIRNELVEFILSKGIFRPELINRFDDIVVFHPFNQEQTKKIAEMRLTELKEKLLKQFIDISFSDKAIDKTANESFDPDFGARKVRRYIEENIENLISREILEEKVKKGDDILIDVDSENNFIIQK